MATVATTHLLRLAHAVGLPQLRPFSWQNFQAWAATVGGTSDVHYLIVAFSFLGHRPMVLLMASPAILASLRLASFLKQRMPSLQRAFDPFLSKRVRAVLVACFLAPWWGHSSSSACTCLLHWQLARVCVDCFCVLISAAFCVCKPANTEFQ
jgi:hypothetical protein